MGNIRKRKVFEIVRVLKTVCFEFSLSHHFSQDCGENVHQFPRFGKQSDADQFRRARIKQAQPISGFFRLLPAGLNPEQKIFFTYRLIRLDLVSPHRPRGTDQLPTVLEITGSLWQLLDEVSRLLCEEERPLFQIIRPRRIRSPLFFHFCNSTSYCFGFRYSNFEFSNP